eukprot:6205788-Pleurochrysis_carterae.AAC.2
MRRAVRRTRTQPLALRRAARPLAVGAALQHVRRPVAQVELERRHAHTALEVDVLDAHDLAVGLVLRRLQEGAQVGRWLGVNLDDVRRR